MNANRAEPVSLRSWIAVLGSVLGAFMAVLDIQITNASLANILGSLGATLEEGSWISTSYLVAEIVVIPLTGWLAYGRKRTSTRSIPAPATGCASRWSMSR